MSSAPRRASSHLDRRSFLFGTTGVAVATSFASLTVQSVASDSLPSPSPADALKRLLGGHERYTAGSNDGHRAGIPRSERAEGQQPIAAVLSCSDSRVVPDFVFDQAAGRLFVVRVAGNFVTDDGLASLEYGVEFLGIPLIVVLGHSSCGAVDAAIKVAKDGAVLPGKLPGLAKAIVPAVKAAEGKPGDLLANAIAENVKRNVQILHKADPIVGPAAQAGTIQIVGGVYDIASGRVNMLD